MRCPPAGARIDGAAGWARFGPVADNYLIPAKDLVAYVDAGQQAHVPLLQGGFGRAEPPSRCWERIRPRRRVTRPPCARLFGADAERVLALYPPARPRSRFSTRPMTLASDHGMAYNMWRLAESHRQSSGKPVYRYFFTRPRPRFLGAANQTPGTAGGIVTNARRCRRPSGVARRRALRPRSNTPSATSPPTRTTPGSRATTSSRS